MNENKRVVKRKLYRKVVRRIVLERCPTFHIGGCPMDCFRELSNNSPQRIVQCIYSKGCPIEFYRQLNKVFSRTKTFCFEDRVSHNWHMHA